jgi:hypothetical protein
MLAWLSRNFTSPLLHAAGQPEVSPRLEFRSETLPSERRLGVLTNRLVGKTVATFGHTLLLLYTRFIYPFPATFCFISLYLSFISLFRPFYNISFICAWFLYIILCTFLFRCILIFLLPLLKPFLLYSSFSSLWLYLLPSFCLFI